MKKYYKAIEGTDTFEQYGKSLIPAWKIAEKGFPRNEIEWLEPQDIAEAIRGDYSDDMDAYAELCDMADMLDEWEMADDNWPEVADKAAEKLGVEI